MKIRIALLTLAFGILGLVSSSQAGGRCWGGWGGGPRVSVGVGFGGWGGYCGPRFGRGYGPGWGWGGPRVAVAVPMYRRVVVGRPLPVASAPSATLVMAQSQLANLGYYDGMVDGLFGPRTSRAIRQYQADYGLAITGRLDRQTLASLRG